MRDGPGDAPAGVSVVVPNWNGEALLARNLPAALAAARAHPAPCEVIVVDDGSRDGSRDAARAHPEVRLVEHAHNRGFGAACASGVEAARQPLVLLLNSDARPEPGALAPLARAFADPAVFAATPLVLDPDGRVSDVTIRLPYLRRGRIRFRNPSTERVAAGAGLAPWFTFFPLGGAILVRRDRFLALGGFDPLYHPFYYEDVDLGFRAWRRGWRCVVVPESRVAHDGGATIGRAFPALRVRVIRKRNRALLHVKNLTAPGGPALFLAQQGLRSIARLARGDATELLGTAAALPRLRAALAGRRAERAAAVCSDRDILERIEARWRENLATTEGLAAGGEVRNTPSG